MTEPTTVDYSKTLHLPQTDFPMRAGLPVQEPKWVERWLAEDVYGKLRATREKEEAGKYIVHLGPPYANGNFHMGHALTYVLKDFVVRSKFMAGLDSPYVPGWDCHGLPIEWKIETELREQKKSKADLTKKELRARCRAYATNWIGIQKAEWQRLGAIGDWERPYMTMSRESESGTVAELGKLVQRGLVYRGLRPTLWSWAEETALAEAEVEYADKESLEIYVALPIVGRDKEYVVIWTTTPWTLPANRAVAVKADETYVAFDCEGHILWVAEKLADTFSKIIWPDKTKTPVKSDAAKNFIGLTFKHPLYDGMTGPIVDGFHVTTDSGTGVVHIAPSHGADDFTVGQQNGLDVKCPVDGSGKYENWVPKLPRTGVELAGRSIWKCQEDIIAELDKKGFLMKQGKLKHSYPVSWRSKEKLIFRTTHQWFVDLDKKIPQLKGKSVREASLACIFGEGARGVNWVPASGANRIGEMIRNRPDWCISRQRAWGVPITIMVDKATGEPVADEAVWAHILALVAAEGIDAWDDRLGGREAELFPDGWLKAHNKNVSDFEYVTDILDVWFDSGTTHAHVLRAESGPGQRFHRTDGKRPADLYQEGSDQHRGWFHSAMLTSVANYGDAPYENVVTSGFVVDGDGRKFSKSLGNGVEPRQLLEKYGMDIVRLWVASSDYSEDIRYSPVIMDNMADAYRRFRNTFRWLLGNLNGFDAAKNAVSYDKLPELEQYILHRLHEVLTTVRKHYDEFHYHKAYKVLYEFCGGDLSNFYFDVRKDVLYCDPTHSAERLGCLTVLDIVFRTLTTYLAPILVFTCDEAWRSRFGQAESVHLGIFAELKNEWKKDEAFEERWKDILFVRSFVNGGIEQSRASGHIGANTEAKIGTSVAPIKISLTMKITDNDKELLRLVCGVSEIHYKLSDALMPETMEQTGSDKHTGHKCPRCWRYYEALQTDVCARCDDAVKERA